ncbi:peptidoglycan-recognition protein [Frankliniella occidentalis]|nr:peptidoglycan-recognition protein [Frankliniella occidentalis]
MTGLSAPALAPVLPWPPPRRRSSDVPSLGSRDGCWLVDSTPSSGVACVLWDCPCPAPDLWGGRRVSARNSMLICTPSSDSNGENDSGDSGSSCSGGSCSGDSCSGSPSSSSFRGGSSCSDNVLVTPMDAKKVAHLAVTQSCARMAVGSVSMTNASAQIGNISNFNGPVTVVVGSAGGELDRAEDARPEPPQLPDRLHDKCPTVESAPALSQPDSQTSTARGKFKSVRELQREHMDVRAPALDDIEFNFLVGGDGAVYEGRGWDAVGRPLGGWHHESLSVAMIGTFHQRQPTAAQADAALRFVEWAMSDLERIRTDYRAAGACQFEDTDSPGARVMDMLVVWPHWWNHSTVDAPCIPMRKAQSALS